MKIRGLVVGTVGAVGTWVVASAASAGGLTLPGDGVISTSRAGASVAAVDDGESVAVNPAGMAKVTGTVISVGAVMIDYNMQFTRTGTYDIQPNTATTAPTSYDGQAYPTIKNTSKPPLGIGSYQPVPTIAIVSDLGNRLPGFHVGFALYAPNAYPFRDMSNGYVFNQTADNVPPPPTRYDVMQQSAAIVLPTVAVSYRITPDLDVGAKFASGIAQLKSTTAVWGLPGNYTEYVKQDGVFTVNASDDFVPVWGLGATYRPTPHIELGAQYTSEIDVHAKGNATAEQGPAVMIGTNIPVIAPAPAGTASCAEGGTLQLLKACVDFALPQTAQLGGRYKFLDANGAEKGDVELDLDWENWAANSATNYTVTVDGSIQINGADIEKLQPSVVAHGLRNTYGARLGGSYRIPAGNNTVILRGGVAYDTAAAKPGWERVDLDGAARTTISAGASYRLHRVQIDAGLATVLEGTVTNPGDCNPTASMQGCQGTNMDAPTNQRSGPDPINPLLSPTAQFQNPVNQGVYKAYYLMFMLGASTWF